MARFVMRSPLPVPPAAAFDWHTRPGALPRLTPPWERVEIVEPAPDLQPGRRVVIRVKLGPIWKRWVAEHTRFVPGVEFQDVQRSGAFARFEHTHRILPAADGLSAIEDDIDYALRGGSLGAVCGGWYARRQLTRMFRYRHRMTQDDLAAHVRYQGAPMKVLVSGATGLVGSALVPFLTTGGHEVSRLVRGTPKEAQDIPWDPTTATVYPARLEGLDAVVHLAGENIAGARWSPAVKERIRSSRVAGTKLLCEALAKLERKPKVLVCASAIGYYGDQGETVLSETSPAGTGFLPEVCQEWEAACEPARQAGIRVVNLRIGVILSAKGGALTKMLFPFKMGGGGIIGSGKQYWSWVALDDVVGIIHHALTHESVSGPVNTTSPQACTNYEFTKTLGRVLRRPTIAPLPGFVARIVLGEMAQDLLLASVRVAPTALQRSGYQFRFPVLEDALRHELGL